MLTIRLQRRGKKKQPTYRVVVSEKARDTQGRSLEILGYYNPQVEPRVLKLDKERILHWLSVGAQTSATVHNMLVQEGIVSDGKKKSVFISKKRSTKNDAKKKEAEVAAKPEAEPKEAPPATAEAPADETQPVDGPQEAEKQETKSKEEKKEEKSEKGSEKTKDEATAEEKKET
jgi:small subunit ribosomal protein S16